MDFQAFVVKHKIPIIIYLGIGFIFDVAATGSFHLFSFWTYLNVLLWPLWMLIGFFKDLVILLIAIVLVTFVVSLFVPSVKAYVTSFLPKS